MGKSTVLRFSLKPIKVVMGNPDQFDVEFIGKDLTLRPKRMVETNIFIYTKERIFGFLIGVKNGREYDDLVHVRWKVNFFFSTKNNKNRQKYLADKLYLFSTKYYLVFFDNVEVFIRNFE